MFWIKNYWNTYEGKGGIEMEVKNCKGSGCEATNKYQKFNKAGYCYWCQKDRKFWEKIKSQGLS